MVIATVCPASMKAMDWETAAEVASCRNQPGYEQNATRVVEILKTHGIYAKVIYFKRIKGIDGITEGTSQADKFGVFVDVRDADAAREVLAEEVKKGLRVTLTPRER